MKHLTLTGIDAGQPICGAKRDGPGIHAAYYRADTMGHLDICPLCLAVKNEVDAEIAAENDPTD